MQGFTIELKITISEKGLPLLIDFLRLGNNMQIACPKTRATRKQFKIPKRVLEVSFMVRSSTSIPLISLIIYIYWFWLKRGLRTSRSWLGFHG